MTKLNKQPAIYNLALIACILQTVYYIYLTVSNIKTDFELFNGAYVGLVIIEILGSVIGLIPTVFYYIAIRKSHKNSGRILLGIYFIYFAYMSFSSFIQRIGALALAGGYVVEAELSEALSQVSGNFRDIAFIISYIFIAIDILKGATNKKRLNAFLTVNIYAIVLFDGLLHAYYIISSVTAADTDMTVAYCFSLLYHIGLLLNRAAVLILVKHNTLIIKKLPEDAAHPSPEQAPEN